LDSNDVVNVIIQTINTIFSNLFSSIDNSMYDSLDNYVFIDSSVLNNNVFKNLLGFNGNGFLYLTDAMLIGVALFYIVRFYFSNIVDVNVERPGQFIFKLLVFAICINCSYFLIQQFMNIFSLVTGAIRSIGKDITSFDISFAELIKVVNKILSVNSEEFNIFSFDGIIKSFVTFGLVNLLILYSIRYILIQVLILFTPFAVLSLINSSTSWIFKSWFRSLLGLMFIQLFVPLVLIIVFMVKDTKLLFVGGIYALSKINDYVREMFGGISVSVSSNMSSLISMFKK
jgi:type IV secretory pathway VirB6-like protein